MHGEVMTHEAESSFRLVMRRMADWACAEGRETDVMAALFDVRNGSAFKDDDDDGS